MIFLALIAMLDPSHSPPSLSNPLPDWALGGFVRAKRNPILMANPDATFPCPMRRSSVHWQAGDVFNPASTTQDGKICVLFRAEDDSAVGIGSRTSRIGLAHTSNGWDLKSEPHPVLFPAEDDQKANEWPGGCEDPRVAVSEDGLYVMAYTQWNRQLPRLAIATSKDLHHWTKFGPAFRTAYGGKFAQIATKSASIVTALVDGHQVIAKVQGKYWMYWGENGVHAATSDDLTDWTPVVDEKGNLQTVIQPRPKFFDSDLTECGPPAVLTDRGIVLIYNGKNNPNSGDTRFRANSYCAGQILISPTNPMVALERLDVPFFRPVEPFEKSGQYQAGTVFCEGLTYFQGKWFLYYGCADSRVGVAIFDPKHRPEGDPIPGTGQ